MFKEYIDLYKTYTQTYGAKTAIFLMVGSFYELYDIQDTATGETQANVKEIVEYLGIQLSSKKGEVGEGKDGLFAGFPDYVMHKWAGRLTSAGWTVVIVDQIKDTKGKVKERKVSRILSPSTHVENSTTTETPYVMTIYLEQQGIQAPTFGTSLLDLTTGSTRTYSGIASGLIDVWTADDLVQLMSVYPPKEVLMYWKSESAMPEEQHVRRLLGLPPSVPLHRRIPGAFSKELTRTEYLQQIYAPKTVLPIKTYLGLRSDAEEMALLYLLQFVEEHVPSMLQSFHRNEPWIPNERLICGNHALTQLQMTGSNDKETVIGLFDKCITAMGKRAIKERLLTPYSDAITIKARLEEVKDYMMWPEAKVKTLEKQLRFMMDLPRLHRRMLCGLITPQEMAGLFQTYAAMDHVMHVIVKDTLLQQPFSNQEWTTYTTVVSTHFMEEKARSASHDLTAFHPTTYPAIGKKEEEIQQILGQFQYLRKTIAQTGGIAEDALRLEEREKEPFGLKGSSVTLAQLKKNIKNLPEGTTISELKSGGWVDNKTLQQLNTALQKAREQLDHLVRIHLVEACTAIAKAGQHLWTLMEHWICHVDCTQCIATVSQRLGFHCPTIEPTEGGSSVEIYQVRHPLVEATATRVAYVKHDVKLGADYAKGWLVYGMNASGKSTLMKATGICILLAQAGCFVPAKSMTLRPFNAIYTRILNQDNLFAGLSSFAVEMSELRDILRHADAYTLVLGDELCSGTESISAQALVASGIQWLSSKHAKFIFATHLHDLTTLVDTKKEGVEVWHLHVEYDPMTKKLLYDRSLRPGNGSSLYGLEVARAMDLPFAFIEQAMANRHKILGSISAAEATASAWNTSIMRKECELCKAHITRDLEVHHVKPRASAKQGLLEDGTPMNDQRNLIVICQKCHDEIHAGSKEPGVVQVTSDGPERIHPPSNPLPLEKRKSKWTDEELQTVTDTLKTYSSLSLKAIRAHLSSKHAIEMSETALGSIRKGL
jgi:DNA mismatch repair protein MutS